MASEFVVLAKKRKKIRSVSFITYITVSHQNSLQQKYSNNDTIANHSHLQLYIGGGGTICTLKSTALQTNMKPSPITHADEKGHFRVVRVYVHCVCNVICSRPAHPKRCDRLSCCLFPRSWWGHCLGQWALWTWTRRHWPKRKRKMWAEEGCRSLLHLCCEKHTSTPRFRQKYTG